MRKYLLSLILIGFALSSFAQFRQTTNWTFDASQNEVKVGDEIELIFNVNVVKDWYIYSSNQKEDVMAIPATAELNADPSFEVIGKLYGVNPKHKYDPIWGDTVEYFGSKGEFRQKIRILKSNLNISGVLDFQTCTDVTGQCVPGEQDFLIDFIKVAGGEKTPTESPTQVAPQSLLGQGPGIRKVTSWKLSKEGTAEVGSEIDLVFNVTVDANWYIYSSDLAPDASPIPATVIFEETDGFEVIGGLVPTNPKKKFDNFFNEEVTYFSGKGEFKQRIKILKPDFQLKGELDFQTCSDVEGLCINGNEDFDVAFSALEDGAQKITAAAGVATGTSSKASKSSYEDLLKPEDNGSLWGFFITAFLFGLAALLTPCVFPMIPMTVAFFTNSSQSKAQAITKASIYGVSIIVIYILIGLLFTSLFGVGIANELATGAIPNIIFFAVFVVFALSFFGLFEIVLPSGLVNRMDKKANKGGMFGTFFMAFTLVLVSFSCTGPIVGTILIESFQGQVTKPVVGMLGFSIAFAIPFTLFAIFPGMLKSLPKSGGWLNSVKVVLGFIELALGFKFLSVADQAYHWGLLDREIYIAIWLVIAVLLGFYLLGKLRLPHDDEVQKTSVPRLVMAIISFVFAVYLLPGMFGAPLKGLSGYLPPLTTHDFAIREMIREEIGNAQISGSTAGTGFPTNVKYSNILHLPHGIKGFFDYEQAMAYAKKVKKPLFIDFTGHGCVNCRKMEEYVWSDPEVLRRMKEDYVVVALYVDDKTELPESEWYTSEFDNKVKKTIGKQNFDFQITRFNGNAQPYYVLLDNNEQALVRPKSYDAEVSNFVEFLDKGLAEFAKR
ncbi:protein-disulfide reductase DsbD family protein [Roseivirga sp.]|uniref:protein-disulfide reductase DsbD family protein n=1 Tax=Roseivirga sp. TaxID=1964215 RepID=UPI002B2765E0|nr:protein-disulfide reductase DsbD domain-containing protein [Roseivirga sp.]